MCLRGIFDDLGCCLRQAICSSSLMPSIRHTFVGILIELLLLAHLLFPPTLGATLLALVVALLLWVLLVRSGWILICFVEVWTTMLVAKVLS